MKKRICAGLMAVLLFVAIPFTAFANPAAVAVGKFLGEWVLGELLSMVVYKIPDLIDGSDNDYSGFSSTAILAYWDDILDETTITEEDLRTHLPKITSEEYYWMFADCNASIDDIVAYCFGTSDKSGTAFETVNTFVTTYSLSEADLRALFELVYTHRTEVYDFTAYTMRVGVTIDDICEYCFSNGVASDNSSSYVDDGGNAVVSGELFNDIIKKLNEQYGPAQKTDRRVVSIQNPIHSSYSVDGYGWAYRSSFANTARAIVPIRLGADLFLGQDKSEIWLFPFFDDNDNTSVYYGQWQIRLYHKVIVNDDGSNTVCIYADFYDNIDNVEVLDVLITDDVAMYPYIVFMMGHSATSICGIYGFAKYDNFLQLKTFPSIGSLSANTANTAVMFGSDGVVTDSCYNLIKADTFDPIEDGDDVGFITSSSKFDIGFFSTPLPDVADNYYITISGGNIYDYSITNPDTGDTTTINYYITNNYTFPDNGDDNGGESGGTTSGDVNVGGNVNVSGDIDVGGKVDINVDVNINDNTSSGSTESQPSYIDGEDINLDEYIEKTPEIASGFRSYMEKIMSWLPADILGVMILGVVVAVWCRLAGR